MKLAVVRLPNERGCEFVLKDGEVAPPIFFFSRFQQVVVLAGLLLCALALVGTTYFAASEAKTIPATPSVARPARTELPRRPMVHLFDGSRRLKAGDLVLLNGAGASQVRKVAAAPNEAVLLRSGNALHALYMAGESSYVVMSERESRIVSHSQIHAVVPPALKPMVQ